MRKPPRRSAPSSSSKRAQRARAEQLAVALVEAAEHGHPEPIAREPERRSRLERLLEQRGDVALAHPDVDAVDQRHELLRSRHDRDLDRARHDLAQPRIALEPRDVRLLLAHDLDPVDQLGHGPLLDGLLAERRQDVRDVVHEGRVRPDDEHAPQPLAMRVEEPGRAVQPDGRLAGAGTALHDERAFGLGRDQPVLVRLDRGDDVAHPHVAAAVELLEQEVGDARALDRAAVQRLVGDVGQAPALGAEAAPLADAVRLLRRRRVEGPRGGRLPVDDQRLVLVVVHPAAADVERPRRPVDREPPEDEPALGVLEGAHAPLRPRLHVQRGPLGGHRLLGTRDRRPHALELVVGVVDVGLLGCELGVRHGR